MGSGPWRNVIYFHRGPIRVPWEPLWAPRNNRQNLTKITWLRDLFGTLAIWNTLILYWFQRVSASFTGITHYLYTIGFLVYLHNQSTLIPQSNTYQNTFYSYKHSVTSISALQFDSLHILLDSIFAPTSLYLYILKPWFTHILNMATTTQTVILDTTVD